MKILGNIKQKNISGMKIDQKVVKIIGKTSRNDKTNNNRYIHTYIHRY